MAFDFSEFTSEARRIAHRAGRGDGGASRDADWISCVSTGGVVGPVFTIDGGEGDDVTQQIEAACRALSTAKQGTIILPPSAVLLTRPMILGPTGFGTSGFWDLAGGYRILGQGQNSRILYRPDAAYKAESAIQIGNFDLLPPTSKPATEADVTANVVLAGFTIRADASALTSPSFSGIDCVWTVGLQVQNVLVYGFSENNNVGDGIRIQGATNADSFKIFMAGTTATGCTRGLVLDVVANVVLSSCTFAGSAVADVDITGTNNLQWFGGDIESQAPYGIYAHCEPGKIVSSIALHGIYNETADFTRTLFFFSDNGSGLNPGAITITDSHGVFVRNNADTHVFHFEGCNGIELTNNNFSYGNAVKGIYARLSHNIHVDDNITALDLDDASSASLHMSGTVAGHTIAAAAIGQPLADRACILQLSGGSIALPAFALGQEPADAVTGDAIFCSSTSRIAWYNGTIWQQAAVVDDDPAVALGATLVEYWDTETPGLIGLVSGDVDTWTGYLRGLVLTAPGAGNRPAYASDADFGGHNSLQFDGIDDVLQNLAIAPALLSSTTDTFSVVIICKQVSNSTQQKAVGMAGSTGGDIVFMGRDDSGAIGTDVFYGASWNPGTNYVMVAADTNADFVAHLSNGGAHYMQRNDTASSTGGVPATVTDNVTKLSIGDGTSGGAAAQMNVVAVYVMRGTPGVGAVELALQFARNRYGVAFNT